ncbi:MAG: holo-ACP synthase [Alteromonadaceae bacterium]|nr:holo-ACP synthase [Alteromonadaceae bacterium]
MSVVGIGTDIIEIARIGKMKDSARAKLAQRVLTKNEFARYQELNYSTAFLAKRWAAKEAASKALGRGIADGISFQHFEISSLDTGQPILTITDRALVIANKLGANSWHISIADEKEYATAFVVLSQ